jgi:hypothetical protein
MRDEPTVHEQIERLLAESVRLREQARKHLERANRLSEEVRQLEKPREREEAH